MRTTIAKSLMPALFGFALMSVATASADEQHHESDVTNPAPSATMPAQPGTTPSTQMMAPMMNMMSPSTSGMPTMNMPIMNMMGQGGVGMMGSGAMPMEGMPDMGAHLEGRIAFLRAELGITDAQMPQWEAFAKALRDSAAKIKQAQAAAPLSAEPASFLQHAELQERVLSARLEGLKAVKAAFAALQAVLSEDQKRTAETLLTRPACFGPMGVM
jgi:LTXXQ motif family protein